ncbi:MAG: KH domain-containing protein [Actinomycetota bacterium]
MAEAPPGNGIEAPGEVAASTADLVEATLLYLARSLVAHTDEVRVERTSGERGPIYRLHVNAEDLGRVIGRSGRIARAIRQIPRAAAARAGTQAIIEIAD